MDHAHGRHVIQPRIDAAFVDEGQSGIPHLCIQGLHGRRDVGGRGHHLAVLEAQLGHADMLGGRQQGNGDITIPDPLFQSGGVLQHVQGHGPAAGSSGHQGLGLGYRAGGHGDVGIVKFGQIVDNRSGDQTGAKDQNSFIAHCFLPFHLSLGWVDGPHLNPMGPSLCVAYQPAEQSAYLPGFAVGIKVRTLVNRRLFLLNGHAALKHVILNTTSWG